MSGILQSFAYGRAFTSPPVNVTAPVVSGTATVGQTLSCTTGTWTGLPTPTFAYQWQRVTTNISGATSSSYVLVAADAGSTIRCVVTATNSAGVAVANSNSTASVAATVPGAPTIGTATATGSSTATVAYTAPASNGGATITSYTATSSPGSITGTLSTAGSGTITVTGLSETTSYTFTVRATNSAGQSAASAASNSITTSASLWVTYLGLNNTTFNPKPTQYPSYDVTYGWDVSSSGYTVVPVVTSPSRATYFGVISPSGTRVNGYYSASTPVLGYYPDPYSVFNANSNKSSSVVVMNGTRNAAVWDAATGAATANYTTSFASNFINRPGNATLSASNIMSSGSVQQDPKTGASFVIVRQLPPGSGYIDQVFFTSSGVSDTAANVRMLERSDGTYFFAVDDFGFTLNSSCNSITSQKSSNTPSWGLSGGGMPSLFLCDSSNNLYSLATATTGGQTSIGKINSAVTTVTRYNYTGPINGSGAAMYGDVIYAMYTNTNTIMRITAVNSSTMAVNWSKTFTFSQSGGSINYVTEGAFTTGLRANATGVYAYVNVPLGGEPAAGRVFVFKLPLNGSFANTTYSIGNAVSVTISDSGYTQSTNVAFTTTNRTFSFSLNTSTGGTPAALNWGTNASVLPTVSKTAIT